MGNAVAGGRKKAKVMKIDGETFKLKTPIQAFEVIKDYAGHVLLESKSVKRFGIRANPVDPDEFLEAGKVYFLVELPKQPETVERKPAARRVRSGVNLTAKDRLECLMLSRRSASEIPEAMADGGGGCGSVRVKVRLPKSEVDRLIGESGDAVEVAERIVELCVQKNAGGGEEGGSRRRIRTEMINGS